MNTLAHTTEERVRFVQRRILERREFATQMRASADRPDIEETAKAHMLRQAQEAEVHAGIQENVLAVLFPERTSLDLAGQVYQDLDKRNTGTRLVRVNRVVGRIAECTILTNGGRPCDWYTARPELRGTGGVGQTTRIQIERLLTPSRFKRVVQEQS